MIARPVLSGAGLQRKISSA